MAASSKVFTDWRAVLADIRKKKFNIQTDEMESAQLETTMSRSIPVTFRNKKYNSSSSALDAYIWEHEGKTPKKFAGLPSMDVLDLLSPQVISNGSSGPSMLGPARVDHSVSLEQFIAGSRRQHVSSHQNSHRQPKENSTGTFSDPGELHKVDSTSTDLLITTDPYTNHAKSLPAMQKQQSGNYTICDTNNVPNIYPQAHPSSCSSDNLSAYISKMEQLHPQIQSEVSASGYKLQDSTLQGKDYPETGSAHTPQWTAQFYSKKNQQTDESTMGMGYQGELPMGHSVQSQRHHRHEEHLSDVCKNGLPKDLQTTNRPPSWVEQIDQSDVTSVSSSQPEYQFSRQKVNPYLREHEDGLKVRERSKSNERMQRASDYLPKPKFTALDKISKIEHAARVNLGSPQAHSSRHGTPNMRQSKKELSAWDNGKNNKTEATYSETILKDAAEETQSVASLPQHEPSSISMTKKKVNFREQSQFDTNSTANALVDDTRNSLKLSGTDFASASIEHCAKHRDFAKKLIEVEDTGSSVITTLPLESRKLPSKHDMINNKPASQIEASYRMKQDRNSSPETVELLEAKVNIDVTPEHSNARLPRAQLGQGDHGDVTSDPSYLTRVQELLNTPSLQRPLEGLELSLIHSADTDSVLDGDRSWEQYLPVKPPVFMNTGIEEPASDHDLGLEDTFIKKADRIVDQFKQQCLDEAEQTQPDLPSLAGAAHPGSMETLKHMIFNLQSLDMSERDQPPEHKQEEHKQGSETEDEAAGAESLSRAMEHLSKLKSLMRKDKKN